MSEHEGICDDQRSEAMSRITFRFGEWYKIWWDDGIWYAHPDADPGELLLAPTAAELEIVIGNHMSEARARARAAAIRELS